MGYITIDDLRKIAPEEDLVQLTDDEGAQVVNAARVEDAIARAEAEVDSACGVLYTVPFGAPSELVKNIAAEIALYLLYCRRVAEVPAVRAGRYREALRKLEAIAGGLLKPSANTLAEGPASSTSVQERAFTAGSMEEY